MGTQNKNFGAVSKTDLTRSLVSSEAQATQFLDFQAFELYSTANDPQPQRIPRPQMIPKMDRKWSSTASDPQSRPQMIPKEK